MTTGPLAFSALKFEVSTLNSWIISVFGLTGVAQLQPGSETWAPSAVLSTLPVPRPLATYSPFSGLLLSPSPFPFILITYLVKFVHVLSGLRVLRWVVYRRSWMIDAALRP